MDINSFVIGYKKGKASGGGGGGAGGAELNIAYGDTPPEDTSKLWVKTEEASGVIVSADSVDGGGKRPASVTNCPYAPSSTLVYSHVAMVDNKIYIFGGRSGTDYSNVIYIFDPITKKVTKLETTMPQTAYGGGCAAVGKDIYIFAGETGSGNYTDRILRFDTQAQAFTTLGATHQKKERYVSCAAIGSRIYVYSGVDSGGISTGWSSIFDTTLNRFLTADDGANMPNMPNASNFGYCCAAVGTKIYIFNRGNLEIYCHDTEAQSVTTLSAILPEVCKGSACCAIGDKVYLFGGYKSSSSSPKKTIYCLDTLTGSLSTIGVELNTGVYGSAAVPFERGAFILCGNAYYIQHFITEIKDVPLDNGLVQIFGTIGTNTFKILNTETVKATIGVKEVYKGNANNEGEKVEAALYKDGEWQTI